ncbi:BTAD domain-containing putative transcriptional regulator [Desulfosarcina ovata]|uniref:Bacterial transcriptional activator domain-containing protein n=1 Tax=Desulfosarcina ovata subsp. ovata TaxID=2752305 RepID=A0A5K8ADC2_9BACT|nr:BTAD domain-containing putative transcriptional regulator [Desulfosarcina ovata]BBO90693.1 hypothetical protein DSCOOX_38730 [Desulfosarcina ovata subsp. ovata]
MGLTRPLISKIAPPELPSVVRRETLFKLLDRKAHYSATWISGAAGAGKTTLVASFLARQKLPFIWYRVDAGDGDLPTFFYYLGQAVKKASPRKRKPLPLLTPDYLPGAAVFAIRFFENVSARLDQPLFMVFDDFQNVEPFPTFHEVFKNGLLKLAANIHVLIMSRSDPPPGLISLLANNRMRIIDAGMLRLSLKETGAILRLETGRPVNSGITRQFYEKSRGWAAGIVLMAKGLRDRQWSSSSRPPIMPSTIFDYFSGELFDKLEDPVRNFMLKTAVLPRMTAAMARAFTGNTDADRILAGLQHKNLFTEKSSDDPPTYQYHALFHRFLIAKAGDMLGPETVAGLKRRAARVLQDAGLVEEAALRLIDVGDMPGLVGLLHAHATMLLDQGRHRPLADWLSQIPAPVIDEHPWLLYWRGAARQYDEAVGARGDFVGAFERFEWDHDERGLLLAWAGIVQCIISEWNDFHAIDPWLDWLDRWIRGAGVYPSPQIEARIMLARAVAELIRRPTSETIQPGFQRALSLARKSGNVDFELQVIGWAMTYQAWMGRFDEVEVIRKTSKALAKGRLTQPSQVIQWKWIDIATRLYTLCGRESILDEIAEAIDMVRKTGLYTWEHKFFMPGIFAALLLSDFNTADAFLKRFEAILDPAHYHAHTIYHHFAGLYALLTGNTVQARAHAETALRIADETGYRLACVICRIQLAYLRHLHGNSDQALETLQSVGDIMRRGQSAVFDFMEMIVRAKIAYDREDERQGLVVLERAFGLGRRHQFLTMVWWWHPGLISYLCGQALVHGIETDYAKTLIQTHRLAPDSQFEGLVDWPRAFHVRTFDTFQLLRDGKPVSFSGKVQKRPLELLKLLSARGGQAVPLATIMDALWPDADGDMAASAFSSALNRLRKLIGVKQAITLTNGKVSFNPRYIWVDVHVFETAIRRGRRLRDSGNGLEALEWFQRAIDAYRGPFLGDENGTPWIIAARERLKNMFLDILKEAGRHRETAKEYDRAIVWYQKGLAIDPLEEHFYQRLMACYFYQGCYAEAVRVYERCRTVLQTHFDVPPARATEELYQRIRNRI